MSYLNEKGLLIASVLICVLAVGFIIFSVFKDINNTEMLFDVEPCIETRTCYNSYMWTYYMVYIRR